MNLSYKALKFRGFDFLYADADRLLPKSKGVDAGAGTTSPVPHRREDKGDH